MPLTSLRLSSSRHCCAFLLSLALAGALAASGRAAEPTERGVGPDARTGLDLTVYNQDLGQVSDRRRVTLQAGANRLAFRGVSRALQPESVLLGGPGVRVAEQVFAYDLITPRGLLEAAIGEPVLVIRTNPATGEETVLEAELLGMAEGPVLRVGGRIETSEPGRIALAELPAGLRGEPTLLARVEGAAAGEAELTLTYLTSGLSWQADYVAELREAEGSLDLTAFVTLINHSGADYPNARLRLVAGEVNQAPKVRPYGAARRAMESLAAAPPGPEPAVQAVSDRYVYTLPRPVSLADRETRQIVLFQADEVVVEREYRFQELVSAVPGADEIGPVQPEIVLKVRNADKSGLGRPLPAGVVRVYRAEEAGPALFVGADRVPHTAEGEDLELALGRAFDVSGTARRTAFERLSERSYETAQEIVVRNAKDRAIEVRLVGHLPPGWQVLSESRPHEAETAQRVVWTLSVPAEGEASLSYRVRVSQ